MMIYIIKKYYKVYKNQDIDINRKINILMYNNYIKKLTVEH